MKKLRLVAGLQPATAAGESLEVEMTPAEVADLIAGLSRMLANAPYGVRKARFSLFGEITQHVEGWVPLNIVPATVAAVPTPAQDEDDDE